MATIKKYITPCITVVEIRDSRILCSSSSMEHICSEFCKHWHFCQDRREEKYCLNKEYN